ncbi:MAG TPA: alpha-galactosidase [Micromonosporaceae bacterium]|jgi:alpha-galactosidase
MALVEFEPDTRTFLLTTPATGYALRVVSDGVRHLHWGARLTLAQAASLPQRTQGRDEVFDDELSTEGALRFGPPAVAVEFPGGVHSLEPVYADHEIGAGTLRIGLRDRHFPLRIDLHYRVYDDADVIERWASIHHLGGGGPIAVDRLDSATWTLPMRDDYRLSHIAGEWAAEFALERVRLPYGETAAISRRGTTRHQVNPWLAIDPGDAGEETGEVWTMALADSGGFHLVTRRTLGGHASVTGGATARRRHLRPGETFTTPALVGAYTTSGFGGASRVLHRYVRDHVLTHAEELPPVLYNSWEGAVFDVSEANQIATARAAAALGVELYVMDDGWFGARDDAHAGLGDWWPSPTKFPNGLKPLADEVHRLGMRFGIWVEPEMVNPDSELYRSHPDWVLHEPHRRRTEVRQQLVLDFARSEVVEWAYGWLTRLVSDGGIDFLKWDMNRPFTEVGRVDAEDPGRLWIEHTQGVYGVLDRLRADHPDLRIEACASGGGRADLGILRRTDQVWTSDNADPFDRLAIQHGFSQIYPPIVMGAWATASPNPITQRSTPLPFRMHAAMAGALGISGHLHEWTDAERAEAAELIAAYQRIRPVIAHGDLYRLVHGAQLTVWEFVSPDGTEVVVLGLRPSPRFGSPRVPVRLRGLDPDATYRGDGVECSGAVLTAHGLDLHERMPAGDYGSVLLHLRRD